MNFSLKKKLLVFSISLVLSGFIFYSPSLLNVVEVKAGSATTSVLITVCGNVVVESGEECDDGNAVNTDACLNTCVSATCGDSYIWSGSEECDDGNTTSGDGCSSTCEDEVAAPPSGGGGGGGGYVAPATSVVLQGKAQPNAFITILIDGKVSAIINADSEANFRVTLTTLTAGSYTFGLWGEDSAKRKSITFSFTATVTAGMTTTIGGIFIPPTIELEKVNLSRGETLKIKGQTTPESELSIHIESLGEIIEKTNANAQGEWDYLFDTSILTEGSHTTRAKAETPTGLLSSFSKVLGFYIGKYGVTQICPKADFNKDGKTNLIDFSIMLFWWGKYNPCVDQNQNGQVDLADFSILMYWWSG